MLRRNQENVYYDEMPGFLEKLEAGIMRPSSLLKAVKNEGIKDAAIFCMIVSLFPVAVIGAAIGISGVSALQFFPSSGISNASSFIILALAAFYVLSVAQSFVVGGVLHLSAMASGGKGKFQDSYKSYAYSLGPMCIQWVIIFLLFIGSGYVGIFYLPLAIIFAAWSALLSIKGLSFFHHISHKRAAVAVAIPVIILVVVILASSISPVQPGIEIGI